MSPKPSGKPPIQISSKTGLQDSKSISQPQHSQNSLHSMHSKHPQKFQSSAPRRELPPRAAKSAVWGPNGQLLIPRPIFEAALAGMMLENDDNDESSSSNSENYDESSSSNINSDSDSDDDSDES